MMQTRNHRTAGLPSVLHRAAFALLICGGLVVSGCETMPESDADKAAKAAASNKHHKDKALTAAMEKDWKGEQCREFQQTITIGGKTEKAYGTACRQPDGTWKEVDKRSATPPPPRQARTGPDNSFPYEGYPRRYLGPGYAPFHFGVGVGNYGGSVGYGVGF